MQPLDDWQSATTSAYYQGNEQGSQLPAGEGLGDFGYGFNNVSHLVTNPDMTGDMNGVSLDTAWMGSATDMTSSDRLPGQVDTGLSERSRFTGNGLAQPPSMPRLGQAGPSDYALYHSLHNQPQVYSNPISQSNQDSQTFTTPAELSSQPRPPPQSLPTPLISLQLTPTTSNPDITIRNYPNGTVGPSLKRGMACGFCRRRKLRCTAEKPVCANCVKYKRTCEYLMQGNQAEEDTRGVEGKRSL